MSVVKLSKRYGILAVQFLLPATATTAAVVVPGNSCHSTPSKTIHLTRPPSHQRTSHTEEPRTENDAVCLSFGGTGGTHAARYAQAWLSGTGKDTTTQATLHLPRGTSAPPEGDLRSELAVVVRRRVSLFDNPATA